MTSVLVQQQAIAHVMAAAWARERSRQRTRLMATDETFLGRGWAFPP